MPTKPAINSQLDRVIGHIGSEICPSNVKISSSREYLSMLVRVNKLTRITMCQTCDKVKEDNDVTLLLVSSKTGARRLGKTRDTNVNHHK
jgi:hypothetical protein